MKKDILRGLAVLLAGIVLATAAMVGVYALPVDRMHANLAGAAYDLPAEGNYPRLIASSAATMLDNYTDALILNEVIYQGPESLVDKAMCVYERVWDDNKVMNFSLAHNGLPNGRADSYSRYWHGYLVFLKPLFMLFTYSQLRMMNGAFQPLLVCLAVWLLLRRGLGRYAPALVFAYLALYPPAMGLSLQFSPCFYISLLAVCAVLRAPERPAPFRMIFLLAGMATSFLDFLTYPLATWGLPITVYILLQKERGWPALRELAVLSAFWCVGYGGMWAGKWVVATLLTDENAFLAAWSRIKTRTATSEGSDSLTLARVFKSQVLTLANIGFAMPTLVAVVFYLIRGIRHGIRPPWRTPAFAALLAVSISPFVWYAFASNHSFVHYWFTFRTLCISVFAGMCLLIRWSDGSPVPER